MIDNRFLVNTNDSTVMQYIGCYDKLEIYEIEAFTDLFSLLDENTIQYRQYSLGDGFTREGIKIIPSVKKVHANQTAEFSSDIHMYNDDDLKENYFVKSLYSLFAVLPSISASDKFCLSHLFNEITTTTVSIGKKITVDGDVFFPVNNAKEMEEKHL